MGSEMCIRDRLYRVVCQKSYRVRTLDVPAPAAATTDRKNILHTQCLPRSVVKNLKKVAGGLNVSLNDLCLAAYLQQLAEYTEQDPHAKASDKFRILIPISMRTLEHDQISAANVLSYAFPQRRRDQITAADDFVRTVSEERQQILNENVGATLLESFMVTQRVPGLYAISQWVQQDYATAVLANVGEVKRLFGNGFPLQRGRVLAGDVLIRRLDGIAPLRKNTNVAVSFGAYGGELILNLRQDPQFISDEQAVRFLATLCERLTAIGTCLLYTSPSPRDS